MKSVSTIETIIEEFDRILDDDKSLNTRTGLKFAMTLLREAFGVIEEFKADHVKLIDRIEALEAWRKSQESYKYDDKEYKLLGRKMNGETRIVVIQGTISLVSIILAALLVGK